MLTQPNYEIEHPNQINGPLRQRINRPMIRHTDVIKKWIWAYFILLIFEGALRKWLLPGLSTPLLIIRDPIAIVILFMAWKWRILPSNKFMIIVMIIGIISIFTAFYLGHGNLPVALYGARIFILHVPLIFIIGQVFSYQDVLKLGKICLWISLPMTLLIAFQFYSPQSAWINRGIGGDIRGGGFTGALGYFRPPGTFSFTTGVSQFYSLTGVYIIFFWFKRSSINRLILIIATLCLLAAIPLSISRGLFFSVCVSLLFSGMILMRKPKFLLQSIVGIVLLGYLIYFLGNSNAFQDINKVFTARLNMASKAEGGAQGVFIDRYLGGMIGALNNTSSDEPFFGYGSGMGTNVGSMLLTGKSLFLISEGEWGRLIGELGLLMGLVIIIFRLVLSVQLALKAYRGIKYNNILPWLLASFALLMIPQGQWAQPTSLGFSILVGGLVLASLNKYN